MLFAVKRYENLILSFFLLLAQQPTLGQGLLIHEVSSSHNTTDIHALGGIRTQISAGERPQTYTLDRPATGIGKPLLGHLFSKRNMAYLELGVISLGWGT